MKLFFQILTIGSVVLMTILVLLQSQGTGLSTAFGGEGNTFRSKRGAEKVIFNATIVLAVIFVLSVILGLLSKS
jgi:preprotein translocase subunit SecG